MSERTIKSYKNNNEYLFSYLKSEFDVNEVTQVTRKQIKSFINFKLTQNKKASYINSLIKSFRSFFKYLKEEEYIEINPMDNVHLLKNKITIIKTFSADNTKPRTYRKKARKPYLNIARSKKKLLKIGKSIRQQLRFIDKDIYKIEKMFILFQDYFREKVAKTFNSKETFKETKIHL